MIISTNRMDIMNLDARSIPFWIPNTHTANPITQIRMVQKAITGMLPITSEKAAVTSSVLAPLKSPLILLKQ